MFILLGLQYLLHYFLLFQAKAGVFEHEVAVAIVEGFI